MDGWWLLTVHGWVVWAQVISWPMKCPISAMSKRTISSCWPLVQVTELEGKTARKNWQRNGPRQIGDMMIWRPKHQDIFHHDTYTCFIFDDLNLNIYIYINEYIYIYMKVSMYYIYNYMDDHIYQNINHACIVHFTLPQWPKVLLFVWTCGTPPICWP